MSLSKEDLFKQLFELKNNSSIRSDERLKVLEKNLDTLDTSVKFLKSDYDKRQGIIEANKTIFIIIGTVILQIIIPIIITLISIKIKQ
jgi:tetrahydromethanopterin S-methyltransferase subunit G